MTKHQRVADHKATAAQAKEQPGCWFLAGVYRSLPSAASIARQVVVEGNLPAYLPAGAFQAYAAHHDEGHAVWVRYVASLATVPEQPDTMTVRVCDRGSGRDYVGVRVVTVTISARCPRCGGPRGLDTVQNHNFHEDGEWLSVDRWTNPCGHVDMYAAVLAEVRKQPVPPAVTPVTETEPVRLLTEAADSKRIHHARQGADLLAAQGFADEAALIRAEIKSRHGHMSTRQAAAYLLRLAQSSIARKDARA